MYTALTPGVARPSPTQLACLPPISTVLSLYLWGTGQRGLSQGHCPGALDSWQWSATSDVATHTHARTRAHTHTHAHAHAHTRTHARTHARTHTHTHKQTVPCVHQDRRCLQALAVMSTSTMDVLCSYLNTRWKRGSLGVQIQQNTASFTVGSLTHHSVTLHTAGTHPSPPQTQNCYSTATGHQTWTKTEGAMVVCGLLACLA